MKPETRSETDRPRLPSSDFGSQPCDCCGCVCCGARRGQNNGPVRLDLSQEELEELIRSVTVYRYC